jgi:hypothetical protein
MRKWSSEVVKMCGQICGGQMQFGIIFSQTCNSRYWHLFFSVCQVFFLLEERILPYKAKGQFKVKT